MLFLKILFKEFYYLLRSRESRTFLLLALRYGATARYRPTPVHFLQYRFRVPDANSFLWQFKEIFVEEAYYFQSVTAQPVIYDCGANVGSSCAYFKQLYPQARIRAFEADPSIAAYLTDNLAKNSISGVEIMTKAVWVNNDGIEIGQEGADGASVFATGNKVRVPSTRLKEELASETRIDMLKIDIEGAETAVLKDCQDVLSHVQHIFLEYHAYLGQPQDLDEILAILRKNNFRYFIRDAQDRPRPLYNHFYRNNTVMDLQLNIFAYRS
ncbi:MAG: FkbM family methyltransferase [Bacteroidota bacterium]